MKPILATIALLLAMGCQSKPKPCPPAKICTPGGFVSDVYVLNAEGSISHVSQAQWEAAQGLYNPHHVKGFMVSGPWTSGTATGCSGCFISTDTGMLFSTATGTTKPHTVPHYFIMRTCPKGEHRATIDIPIQRGGVACAGTATNDCAEHHVIDVCEKNTDPYSQREQRLFGDTFPPSGDAK